MQFLRKKSLSRNSILAEKPFGACAIEAPCKINLHLRIGKRRPDGFHSIQGIFASIALGDTLWFELGGIEGESFLSVKWETGCHQEAPGRKCPIDVPVDIPMEGNLVLKAISLFRERTGLKQGLNVRLKKRIPVGAGLGGGSSDAASTLLALNKISEGLCSAPLPMDELKEMGGFLGSDVPFFLTGGTAFVGGRGDLVEPLKPLDGLWVVLVKPHFSSDTASAYRLLDHYREQKEEEGEVDTGYAPSKGELIRALDGKIEAWPFSNDFLPVFTAANASVNAAAFAEAYRDILDSLRALGASFAGLSGSGSCCFGVFYRENEAKRAAEKLFRQGNFTRLTFFLAHCAIPVLE